MNHSKNTACWTGLMLFACALLVPESAVSQEANAEAKKAELSAPEKVFESFGASSMNVTPSLSSKKSTGMASTENTDRVCRQRPRMMSSSGFSLKC